MAKEKREEIQFPSLDELFSSQEERDDAKLKRIYDIPLTEIDPFPDHPYKVRDDEDMMNLVESVRINGVITPATVRKKEDGRYELISGHRRKRACELAGIETLRCDVVELDRDAFAASSSWLPPSPIYKQSSGLSDISSVHLL